MAKREDLLNRGLQRQALTAKYKQNQRDQRRADNPVAADARDRRQAAQISQNEWLQSQGVNPNTARSFSDAGQNVGAQNQWLARRGVVGADQPAMTDAGRQFMMGGDTGYRQNVMGAQELRGTEADIAGQEAQNYATRKAVENQELGINRNFELGLGSQGVQLDIEKSRSGDRRYGLDIGRMNLQDQIGLGRDRLANALQLREMINSGQIDLSTQQGQNALNQLAVQQQMFNDQLGFQKQQYGDQLPMQQQQLDLQIMQALGGFGGGQAGGFGGYGGAAQGGFQGSPANDAIGTAAAPYNQNRVLNPGDIEASRADFAAFEEQGAGMEDRLKQYLGDNSTETIFGHLVGRGVGTRPLTRDTLADGEYAAKQEPGVYAAYAHATTKLGLDPVEAQAFWAMAEGPGDRKDLARKFSKMAGQDLTETRQRYEADAAKYSPRLKDPSDQEAFARQWVKGGGIDEAGLTSAIDENTRNLVNQQKMQDWQQAMFQQALNNLTQR